MLSRRYFSLSPWGEMDRLQKEMNRLFNSSLSSHYSEPAGFPAVNVWTNEDSAVVTAEIPGVDIKDVEISVAGETLTLRGKRELEEIKEDARYHRKERGFGNFVRTIELPFSVDSGKVEATLDKGVLTINLPRVEAEKPRKIVVKSV